MINLSKLSSKSLVTAGFVTMLLLIASFVGLWVVNISSSKNLINELSTEQSSVRSVLTVHYLLSQQDKLLDSDPAQQEQGFQASFYNDFKEIETLLVSTWDKQLSMANNAWTTEFVDAVDTLIARRVQIVESTGRIIEQGKLDYAYGAFARDMGELNHELREVITNNIQTNNLIDSQNQINTTVINTDSSFTKSYVLVALLGTFGFALGLFTIYVVRSTRETEDKLMEQGRRIRALHEIISRPDLTFDEQIDETLRLGCKLLGTEIGKLGKQDPGNNASEFLNTIVMSDLPAKRGIVLPLDKTFCNVTFSSPETIAISHVENSDFKDHPAAEFLGMQSYIGCSINVHGKKFGTVNFSNRTPVKNAFTETDKDLVNLMGSWISVMMERLVESEQLKSSKEVAEAANQAKSAFLANMSHEIRTPLTAILGYSDMLRDEDQSRDEVEHEVDSIIRSGSHLQSIINDILDLSKIEAGQLVIENINVEPAKIMHDVESIFGARARDKGLDFEVSYDFPVPKKMVSDPTRLKQIVFNLCGNAIKFTEQGSVKVHMGYLQDEGLVKFQISDTGIGMNQDEMSRLFKPFSQADSSTTRRFGGTGLGLCISRQLAQKLGGDVWVDSEKEVGSTFSFTVSVGDVEQVELAKNLEEIQIEAIEETANFEPDSVRGHVLVVEDSPDNQDLISKYLIKAGATVDVVDNGLLAVQKALTENFDLILMDVQMPIMDGLQATKKLRAEGYTKPIVNITANAMKEDRDKCIAAGSDDYLMKPVDIKQFYRILKTYLRSPEEDKDNIDMAV